MRANLIQLVSRNWPIKLAALFLSLMLYVGVQLQQPVTQSFPIKLDVQVPRGRTLRQKPPTVWVEVSGTASQLLKLRSLPSAITKQVPDTLSSSAWNIHLEANDLSLPKGADIRVAEIRPRDVTVTLDGVARKDVRIVPLVRVVAESGYTLQSGMSTAPSTARIVGPDKLLAAIESVTTLSTEISHVTASFSRIVPIDTTPLGIVRIAPNQVTVSVEVAALAERAFVGIPVETGAGAITSFIVSPARVSVAVRGPEARVQALTRDSFRVVAHFRGPLQAVTFARLTVIGPKGISARAVPDSVALRRRSGRG